MIMFASLPDNRGCKCRKAAGEESPSFRRAGCRITSGEGDLKTSATEINRRACPGKGGKAV